MRRALLLLATIAAIPAWGANATVYVDNTLVSDCTSGNYSTSARNCTGSAGNAYNTINEAIQFVTGSGNTILVRAGTYAECNAGTVGWLGAITTTIYVPSGKSGTVSAWNVIKGYGDGTTTLTGTGGCGQAIVNAGSDFWQYGGLGTNEGFNVTGVYDWDGTSGITEGTVFFYSGNGTDNQRVWGNTFLANTTVFTSNNETVDIYGVIAFRGEPIGLDVRNNTINLGFIGTGIIYGQSSTCGSTCGSCTPANVTISGNRIIYGNVARHAGIFSHGSRGVAITGNYFEMGVSGTVLTSTNGSYCAAMRNSCEWTLENNYCQINDTSGSGYAFYVYDEAGVSTEGHTFRNNTIYGRSAVALFAGRCNNCPIRNNAIVGYSGSLLFGTGLRSPGSNGCALGGGSTGGAIGHQLYNNVTTNELLCGDETLDPDVSGRPHGNVTSAITFDGTSTFPTPFLRLQAGSPAINAGTSTGAPSTDYDGETRTGNPDIGADEFSSGGAVCGNGIIESPEVCDGSNFGGDTCVAHGCAGGTLTCTGSCSTISTASCTGCDSTAPAAVTMAASQPPRAPELGIKLSWTATGDDNNAGTATTYQLRMSNAAIGSCAGGVPITEVENASGVFVSSLPTPLASGNPESVVVKGLRPNTTYRFRLCVLDEAANFSISNEVIATTAKYEGRGHATTGGGSDGTTSPVFCRVTNTNDSGTGSFRGCAALGGGRTVIPTIAGTVSLLTRVDLRPLTNWTFDGSSAPSPGFTITTLTDLDDPLRLGNASHVIFDGLRLQGRFFWTGGNPAETADLLTTNNIAAADTSSNLVFAHITARDIGDAALDLWDDSTDVTITNCFFMRDFHSMTTGGDPGLARVSLFRNVWAQIGERAPQLTTVQDQGGISDVDIRNNVYYEWGYDPNPGQYTAGVYAIRVRNQRNCTGGSVTTACTSNADCSSGTCQPSPVRDVDNLNIVNNVFAPGPTTSASGLVSAIVYGSGAGSASGDATEEAGPPCSVTGQGNFVSTTNLGDIWVSGNVLPANTCDSYSTVASENSIPLAAQVTTVTATQLGSVVLPSAGTYFRLADEQALIDTVASSIVGCGNGVIDPGETCDDGDQVVAACVYGDSPPFTQVCDSDCVENVNCASPQYCGDGAINGGEPCDGADLGGNSCASIGCTTGTLSCSGSCTFQGCTGCTIQIMRGATCAGCVIR